MTCEDLRDHYELGALGLADEAEQAELNAHLRRGCAICAMGMKRAREGAARLALLAPAEEPGAKLRERVMASVGVESRGFHWNTAWLALAAACLIAAFWLGRIERYRGMQLAADLAEAQSALESRDRQLASLHEALSVLHDPASRQVTFGEGAPQPPRGRVFLHPQRGVLLLASNLPPAPEGRIYEMWVIPKGAGAAPLPAGLFQSQAGGTALHYHPGAVSLAATAAIAVTLEPDGGVPAPTTQPLIVAAL